MTYRQYLFLMIFTTILCWFAFGAVVKVIDPMSSTLMALLFFYTALSLSLIGTFAVVGLVIRERFSKDHIPSKDVGNSFRQAIFFSVLVVGTLILQSNAILSWWMLLLFIGTLTLLEFFFTSQKPSR